MAGNIRLREIQHDDLASLYEFQLDPDSNRMAAAHPRSADAFYAHWENVLQDPGVMVRAILVDDLLAGSISRFTLDDRDSVGYWIGRAFQGRGVATEALRQLLELVAIRPLYARVAVSNVASLRVLQKCEFRVVAIRRFAGDDRYQACEEAILELTAER